MRLLFFLILFMPTLALAQTPTVPFTPAVIFNGDQVRTLRSQIDIFGAASILTGSTDPTGTAVSAPQGSIYLRTGASGGQVYVKQDSGSSLNWLQMGAGGSVGSVGLSMPGIFSVANSPITTTGTLAVSLNSQAQNSVWAGPSGSSGLPSFRALVASDIPNLSASIITSGQGTLSTATSGVQITSGTNALLSSAAINILTASSGQNGLLTSSDWTAFNAKVPATRNINTTAPLAGGGALSTDLTLSMPAATSTQNGYLSSTDWSTFNNKQAGGVAITSLTGDVVAAGPGVSSSTVAQIQGRAVSSASPTDGQVLTWNNTSSQWEPQTPGGGGGGDGPLTPYGSQASPGTITASGGITAHADQRQVQFTQSAGGAVAITANPQVSAGATVGQELVLFGTSATNYISLADGTGLSLNGPINLTNNAALTLVWNGSVWSELSRR